MNIQSHQLIAVGDIVGSDLKSFRVSFGVHCSLHESQKSVDELLLNRSRSKLNPDSCKHPLRLKP